MQSSKLEDLNIINLSNNKEQSDISENNFLSINSNLDISLPKSRRSWKINEGDGAFYGPKIDVKIKDLLGRSWQLGTFQLDFQLPMRFNLSYKSESGQKWPVMIHRALLGSLERFIAILIEHTGGKWPFWLNPKQIWIVTVSNDKECINHYSNDVNRKLKHLGFMSEVDSTNQTLSKKIRNAQISQTSYILVIGDNEQNTNTVHVRTRDGKQIGSLTFEQLIDRFNQDLNNYV